MAYPTLDKHADYILKSVAQQIAYEYGLDYVGSEHVLLAILRHGQGIGAKVLSHLQVTEERVREATDALHAKDLEDTWVLGRLPGSPHYRNVMAMAIDEAMQLEARQIGTEHLLLALLRERMSTAARVLEAMNVTIESVRAETLKQLAKVEPKA